MVKTEEIERDIQGAIEPVTSVKGLMGDLEIQKDKTRRTAVGKTCFKKVMLFHGKKTNKIVMVKQFAAFFS